MGKQWKYWQVLFSWAPKSLQMVTGAMKLKDACILKEKLDSILKSRDITLPTKVCLVKALVFPIVMYGWESWTIKKAEHQRIDAFELWCWRWLLRIPWIAERSNQSILKEVNPEYSLEGLMLKLQQFGHLMRRADSLEKTLMLGKIEGIRGRGRQRTRWLDSITDLMDMSLSKLQEMVKNREAWHANSPWGHSQTWLTDWTTMIQLYSYKILWVTTSSRYLKVCQTICPKLWFSTMNMAFVRCFSLGKAPEISMMGLIHPYLLNIFQ